MFFREIEQRALQALDQGLHMINAGTQVQPYVSGDLIIARAPGMQALAGVADHVGQAFLDIQMNVFKVQRPREGAVADFGADARQALFDGFEIGGSQDADGTQHACVGDRALNVEFGKALVEADGCGEAFDQIVNGFAETAGPGFGRAGFAAGGRFFFCGHGVANGLCVGPARMKRLWR